MEMKVPSFFTEKVSGHQQNKIFFPFWPSTDASDTNICSRAHAARVESKDASSKEIYIKKRRKIEREKRNEDKLN